MVESDNGEDQSESNKITTKRVKSDNIEWWKSDKGEELCNGEK
jgi:hypothetical protein